MRKIIASILILTLLSSSVFAAPLDLISPDSPYYAADPVQLESTQLLLEWEPVLDERLSYYALAVGSQPGRMDGLTTGNGWFTTAEPRIVLNLPDTGEEVFVRIFAYDQNNLEIAQLKDYRFISYLAEINPEPEQPVDPEVPVIIEPVSGDLTAVWANAGNKLMKSELIGSSAQQNNSVWDGEKISLFAAKNEVVDFNLILEAALQDANNVVVEMSDLVAENGDVIRHAERENIFDWSSTEIELFFIDYLKIEGLSAVSYDIYDERHIPEKMRQEWSIFPGTSKGLAIKHHLFFENQLSANNVDELVYYFENRDNIEPNDAVLTETATDTNVFENENMRIVLLDDLSGGFEAEIFALEGDNVKFLDVYPFSAHWRAGMYTAPQSFNERPGANQYFPEIAVPLELKNGFSIPAGENQAIWADIYVPEGHSAGVYSGEVKITNNGEELSIPVELEVLNFALPNENSAKNMVYYSDYNLVNRYGSSSEELRDLHFQVAKKHRIELIDEQFEIENGVDANRPSAEWIERLSGELYSSENGYNGPGMNTGNDVYSIGTYGAFENLWDDDGDNLLEQAEVQAHANEWENWFENNFPEVERFVYLMDEPGGSSDLRQKLSNWTNWLDATNLDSLATVGAVDGAENFANLDIAPSAMPLAIGGSAAWEEAISNFKEGDLYFYNGKRPASGSFAIEDEATALRQLPWAQYKLGIDRWFYWESTYYNNFQAGEGETDVFNKAQTFGLYNPNDFRSFYIGKGGWNYSNGDGVLFYPGTDVLFPESSYGVAGPFASLRMKNWRRGIQDVEYMELTRQLGGDDIVNAALAAQAGQVLYEVEPDSAADPTYSHEDVAWSSEIDDFEILRREMANYISANVQPESSSYFEQSDFLRYGSPDILEAREDYIYVETANDSGLQYVVEDLEPGYYTFSFEYQFDGKRLRPRISLPEFGANTNFEGIYQDLSGAGEGKWREYRRSFYLENATRVSLRASVREGFAKIRNPKLEKNAAKILVHDGMQESPYVVNFRNYSTPDVIEKRVENENSYLYVEKLNGAGGAQLEFIDVTPGQTYNLSFDYKFNGGRFRTYLNLRSISKAGDFEGQYVNLAKGDQWRSYSRTFTIPEGNEDYLLIRLLFRDGELSVDNVVLEEI